MKKFGFILFLLTAYTASAQAVLNKYEYVIVPTQFEGFRSENQYQTSTMVKYHLTQKGMNAFYENASPKELNRDRCRGLFISLQDRSTAFTTRVDLVFKDCEGNEIYRTQTGESRMKMYVEAYREAIGEAFKSMGNYRFEYQKPDDSSRIVINFGEDVKKLPPAPVPPQVPAEEQESQITPVSQDKEQTTLIPLPVEETEAVTLRDAVMGAGEEEKESLSSLYAQKTETGYQLVDTTPSIQFYLRETSLPNVFLAERKGQNGILYQKNERWIFEYYNGADRMQQELQIKF